jgi:periplasmic copper chaperone A
MIRISVAALAACLLAAPASAHDGVHVNGAQIVVVGPKAPVAAAYFIIENHAVQDDRLLAVRTDAAERAELHRSAEADGVMTMTPVPEGFAIDGSGTIALERGGAHVMLLGLTRPLADGDLVTLTLTFERAGEVVVEVPVNPDDVAGEDHSGH